MEQLAFDALSKQFAGGASRRVVLKALAAAWLSSLFRPILIIRPALSAQACRTADVTACIAAADQQLEQELDDCAEVPKPAQCRVAARKRHGQAVKACDPCPASTRCESNVCCPNDQATCAPRQSDACSFTVQRSFNNQVLALSWNSNIAVEQVARTSETTIKGTRTSHFTKIISLAGQPLVTLEVNETLDLAQPERRTVQSSYFYGTSFSVRSAKIITDNGTVSGDIDGRTFSPFPVIAQLTSLSQLQFADGKPAPTVTLDPALTDAINKLSDQARQSALTCQSSPLAGHVIHEDRGIRPFSIGPGQRQVCNACTGSCLNTLVTCQAIDGAGVGVTCVLCPVCCPIAVGVGAGASGACDAAYGTCLGLCIAPGNDCCPVFCRFDLSPGDGCCDSGETCVDETDSNARSGCCPSDRSVCGSKCCAPGESCCGDQCCPTGQCQPGNICCPPGQPVCNGVCCANGSCDNAGNCCSSPGHLCGATASNQGICCAPFDVCCPDTCCGGDNICIDGRICCPRNQLCGHICCNPGQRCVNGACANCGPGTVPCLSVGPNGMTVSICCPPGAECCLGVCCTPQTGNQCAGPGGSCGVIH
jgi:hypothetical protein